MCNFIYIYIYFLWITEHNGDVSHEKYHIHIASFVQVLFMRDFRLSSAK